MFDEYYTELMASFKRWWLVDDPVWVEQRNKDWKVLEKSCFPDEQHNEKYESYFKTGLKVGYIPEYIQFLLTPTSSPEDSKTFFLSDNFGQPDKQSLMSNYIRVTRCARELRWYQKHIKNFSEGVLGDEYEELRIKTGKYEEVYTPDPTKWAHRYIVDALRFLNQGEVFPGLSESISYFTSCLAHATNRKFRKRIKMNEFLESMDYTPRDNKASDIAKEFAEKLKSRKGDIKANWALNAHLDG